MTDQLPDRDPAVGSPEYWRLPADEQLRICEEAAGLCAGTAPAVPTVARPYPPVTRSLAP